MQNEKIMSEFGERTRPRVQGSAPSLNPVPDVRDEGVADHIPIRNRDVRSPKTLQMVVVPRCARLSKSGKQRLDQ